MTSIAPVRRARHTLLFGLCTASLVGCGSTTPRRDPSGEKLPAVSARTLNETAMQLPQDLHGGVAVLLVGYEQDAQFDADRWLFGLLQSETPARVLEVPTIGSRIASVFAGMIDSGMRAGIPSEDWGTVATVYGEGARRLGAFTGTEGGSNMRVLLLDAEGVIRWFHDRGFSAGKLRELDQRARALVVVDEPPAK